MVLEKILESPLDCKEIKPFRPKGNQHWIFIERTEAEAEAPVLWPPDVKGWLIGKDPDAGKDRWQEEKGTTEDEMVGWHHRLNGHEFDHAPRDSKEQGSLECGSPWDWKELDLTEWINNSKPNLPLKTLKRSDKLNIKQTRKKWNEDSVQFSSVPQSCLTLCNPMNRSTPGLPVRHQLPESTQTHVHWVDNAIQPSHYLSTRSPAPNSSQHQGLFQWVALRIRWPKYWSFSTSPSNEYSGLISFRIDWFDLLAVQGTLKSLLQHHSLKASILRHSAFFTVQFSHPYMTSGKAIALTRRTFVGKVISLLLNIVSRLFITFLLRRKHFLISWLQSPSAVILEPKKIVWHCFPVSPWSDGTRCHDLRFLNIEL